MKTFYEQDYPCTIEVKVIWQNDFIIDQIKGLDKRDAFNKALWNWETATAIKFIRVVQ